MFLSFLKRVQSTVLLVRVHKGSVVFDALWQRSNPGKKKNWANVILAQKEKEGENKAWRFRNDQVRRKKYIARTQIAS